MRPLHACHLSLAVSLLGCSSESSTPTGPKTPLSLSAPYQPTFGMVSDLRLARATIIEGVECRMGPAGSTLDSRITVAPGGNATLVCRGTTAEGPKPALVVKDGLCGIQGEVTPELHFVWAPSGQATLVCHLKK
jgi:hypothetical protein